MGTGQRLSGMISRLLVYIAGPYSSNPCHGTRAALDAAEVLIDAGYTPLVPHLSMLFDLTHPKPEDYWYEYDMSLLEHCQILLRLPGESWGADREVEFARKNGIPVVEASAEDFVVIYGVERNSPNCYEKFEVEIKPIIRQRRSR